MIKKYIPNEKEKYMCDKHKKFFKKKLIDWKLFKHCLKGFRYRNYQLSITLFRFFNQCNSNEKCGRREAALTRTAKSLNAGATISWNRDPT